MRADGYPWLYYEIAQSPNEGHLQHGNYSIDDLSEIISQCLWMYQGVFTPADSQRNDIINLPHAFMKLSQGTKLINACTGAQYEIVDIIGDFRSMMYQKPIIGDIPESVKIPPRLWKGSVNHPSELVGATVQIRRLDAQKDQIELVREKGHFLSLPTSARPVCRLVRAELKDQDDKGPEFSIGIQVTREGPNEGKEHFGDTTSPIPKRRRQSRTNTRHDDPTTVPEVYSMFEDAWVDFFLKAKTGRELGWMTQWFKVFMYRYMPVIERIGYNRIIPVGRFGGQDATKNTPESGDAVRLRYGVRTETIYPAYPWRLRNVKVEVESTRPDGTPAEALVNEQED